MANKTKLWFSIYNVNGIYTGNEPEYLDSSQFSWAKEISLNFNEIKNELEQYLSKYELESYFRTSIVTKKNSWKTIALKNWGIDIFKKQIYFPRTTLLLNKYPQIVSASFNLLLAHSKINKHSGDTNGFYRCHLGIKIPGSLPNCGFKVREKEVSWKENEWIVFMDAYEHEAWNETDSDRYIFVIDVLKDEFISHKNLITSTVKTSLVLQKRAEKLSFIHRLPQSILTILVIMLRPFVLLGSKLCNYFKIY